MPVRSSPPSRGTEVHQGWRGRGACALSCDHVVAERPSSLCPHQSCYPERPGEDGGDVPFPTSVRMHVGSWRSGEAQRRHLPSDSRLQVPRTREEHTGKAALSIKNSVCKNHNSEALKDKSGVALLAPRGAAGLLDRDALSDTEQPVVAETPVLQSGSCLSGPEPLQLASWDPPEAGNSGPLRCPVVVKHVFLVTGRQNGISQPHFTGT
ncbi:hypothetical protein TREES_T100001653 [Tupaia chinensis]|uniref:Uncharacterized protein n=1 Tax=Tupaia chinensis TaxID=246437 RepID=L9KJK0_TUPCH|nr:hypothetical protein TREES_T100001653 [Tupaia chinensis]